MSESDLTERERYVSSFLDDMLHFGAAIGTWISNDRCKNHHHRMAMAASRAASKEAAPYFLSQLEEVDREIARRESNQKLRVKIIDGVIKINVGTDDETGMPAPRADKIAKANNYVYAKDFCKAHDGQELVLDEEGKIINEPCTDTK